MIINKQNGNCAFNEEAHIYWDVRDPNKKYISVTTAIHSYVEEFDVFFFLEPVQGARGAYRG